MSRRYDRTRAAARAAALLVAMLLVLPVLPTAAVAIPVEEFAPYQPQRRCHPTAKPGTLELARWLQRKYPGTGSLGIARACDHGGVSEHKEGRAFDWAVKATSARDRGYVRDFLSRIFATDARGNRAALARRMGIMYVLWNDHSYASYRGFAKRDYLSSSCRTRTRCSASLRHRDHVHISLSRAGGRGDTSWYRRSTQAPPSPRPEPEPRPEPQPAPVPQKVLSFADRPYARLTVPGDGEPVSARFALDAGTTYKVTAAGLVTYGRPHQVADAACTWSRAAGAWTAAPDAASKRTYGSLNLTLNGRAVFGSECREKSHRYVATVTPRRKTALRLRLANDGPAASVPHGRIVVTVSKKRTDVSAALTSRPELRAAPQARPVAHRGYGLLAETVSVPAAARRVTTRQELQAGARYRVTVSGVVGLGGGVRADGRCVELGTAWFGSASIDRRVPDQDHGNLYLDGRPFSGRSTGDGCEAHEYVADYTPTRSGRVALAVWDPLARSDNRGALSVRVQRLSAFATPQRAGTSRPRRTEPWTRGREWLQVPADSAKGARTTLRFRKGEQVQLVVRGVVRSHGVQADASCVRSDSAWRHRDPALALGSDPLDLWVDGEDVRWRALGPTRGCSEEHGYTVRYTARKNGQLRLALLDLDHRDNAGTLGVTVLRQR